MQHGYMTVSAFFAELSLEAEASYLLISVNLAEGLIHVISKVS